MAINVTDLVQVGGGIIVTFDDGSVANALNQVVNGQLVYTGLNADQAEALARFNQQNIPVVTQQLDARMGAIQNTAIAQQEETSEGLAGDVANNTSGIALLDSEMIPPSPLFPAGRYNIGRQLYQHMRMANGDIEETIWPITRKYTVLTHEFTQVITIPPIPILAPWCYNWPDEADYTGGYPYGVNVYDPPAIPEPGQLLTQDTYILPFASGQIFLLQAHPAVGTTSPTISGGDHVTPSPLGTITQWQSGYWSIGVALTDAVTGGEWVAVRGHAPDNSTGNKGGPTPIAAP